MNVLRRLVVTILLGVWSFPAVSAARPTPTETGEIAPRPPASVPSERPRSEEADRLAARERQSPDLADFRGGGVSIYIGSGAALVLLIIVLLLILL